MIQMQKRIKTLLEGKEEFISDCKIRNLSQATVGIYSEDFDYFIKFVNTIYPKMDITKELEYLTFGDC